MTNLDKHLLNQGYTKITQIAIDGSKTLQYYDDRGQQSAAITTATQALIDSYDPLPLAKADARLRILEQSQQAALSLTLVYPEFEMQTWMAQEREALAWQADNTVLTPTIDIIAAQRGLDRLILLPRIISHAATKLQAGASYAGERQRLEDIIDGSADLAVINAVSFTAPVV